MMRDLGFYYSFQATTKPQAMVLQARRREFFKKWTAVTSF